MNLKIVSINMPYMDRKVPIMGSVEEVVDFIAQNPGFKFCLYLAEKEPAAWEKSTSRGYMNQVLPEFIYLPVNIQKGDVASLHKFYELCIKEPRIIAINQTQPHKSNEVLKTLFDVAPVNIDTILKDRNGNLKPLSLNGVAFSDWFLDEVGTFEGKTVVLFGVGGAGEPIGREIIRFHPKELILIDSISKKFLADELGGNVIYFPELPEEVELMSDDLIVIYATGKEFDNESDNCKLLLKRLKNRNQIFVDIRPHLNLATVEEASLNGWRAFTGNGMNSRNDFVLLRKIAEIMGVPAPSFDDFKDKVDRNS